MKDGWVWLLCQHLIILSDHSRVSSSKSYRTQKHCTQSYTHIKDALGWWSHRFSGPERPRWSMRLWDEKERGEDSGFGTQSDPNRVRGERRAAHVHVLALNDSYSFSDVQGKKRCLLSAGSCENVASRHSFLLGHNGVDGIILLRREHLNALLLVNLCNEGFELTWLLRRVFESLQVLGLLANSAVISSYGSPGHMSEGNEHRLPAHRHHQTEDNARLDDVTFTLESFSLYNFVVFWFI